MAVIFIVLPTFLAVMSVALFTEKTRNLCYGTATMTVLTELVPSSTGINTMALITCTFCLIALLLTDILQLGKMQSHHSARPSVNA